MDAPYTGRWRRRRMPAPSRAAGSRAVLTLALPLCACGGGGFGGGSDDTDWLYPLTVPTDVVIVDLDGDGRQDVLTLEQFAASESDRKGRLFFYRQTQTGTFAVPVLTLVGVYPWRMAVHDLDGDGAPDVVVADTDTDSAWLLWQDAAQRGQFEPPLQVAVDVAGYDVTVADLDDDGAPDVVLPGAGPERRAVRILYQDPGNRGSFLPASDYGVSGPTLNATAGDLDGDERDDLVTAVRTAGGGGTPPTIALGWAAQQSDGSLGATVVLASQTGLNIQRLGLLDYDGDGARDLFAFQTPYDQRYDATMTVILQGVPPGSFLGAATTRLDGLRGLDDAVFADLNRDIRPDAAVAGFYPSGSPSTVRARVNLFTQSGGGLFAPTTVHDVPVPVSRIAAGDLNGDGATDLVVFAGSDGCQVMLQSTVSPGVFAAPRSLR